MPSDARAAWPPSGSPPPLNDARDDPAAQRFALALAASGAVLFSQDRALRYTWVHGPAFCGPPAQAIGRSDAELCERPEEGGQLERIKRRALDEARAVVEDVCVHRQDQPVWWRLTVAPLRDAAGATIGVTGSAVDVTAGKAAEAARARELARLDALIDNATIGIAVIDDDFRYLRVNPVMAAFGGRRSASMIGRTVAQMAPSLWPVVEPLYRAVRDQGQTLRDVEVDGPLMPGDPQRSFLANYFPVPLAGGRRGVGLVVSEMTSRKRAERELVAAKEAADEANAAKDRFLATLSHELRTPLTPILLSARILELKPDDPATVLGRADVIRRSVETEVRLIDDLLDLTRISRDKIGLASAPVSLHEVIRAAVEVCEADAQAAQVAIDLDLAAGADLVRGDDRRLQQVLWNLLKNAIKFSSAGSRIDVATDNPDPATLRVRVRDRGIGIAAHDLPKLFNPFEQGDFAITRQFGGLGLGLALVQRLVALHGGAVLADSDGPGCGATFAVSLPLMPAADPPARISTPQPAAPGVPGGRVLLIEDHADTAQTLDSLLHATGWQVSTALTAAQALQTVQTRPFDLVLCDLALPDGDGCELLPLLRDAGCRAPAIALTGHGMDADQARTRSAGFACHFVKPVEIAELLAAMGRLTAAPAG